MSNVINIPYVLGDESEPQTVTNLINEDFQALSTSFNGFAAENVLAFPDNSGSLSLSAGQIAAFDLAAIAATTDVTSLSIIYSKVSVFVDPPPLAPGDTSYDLDYLFPTGAALSVGQKTLLMSSYVAINQGLPGGSFVSNTDGQTYSFIQAIIYFMRNADSATHNYAITSDATVYTASNSFYH